ncbi:unnamed protein product [Cylicocyclus nassatus]|uniref:C-type lectin domain-containing protein n=1 Tax=Cylicocyclus nassatus TaxID=53992 RepID=A0AA36H1E6_CYLNA|nr:unnamed protein product [Cylicocyclus nassatus]
MCFLKFLLFALVAASNASMNPNSIEQFYNRGLEQSSKTTLLEKSDAGSAYRDHCDSGWTYFDKTGACYKTFFGETFYSAEYMCNMFEGHLTSIHSFDENLFVAEMAKMGKPFADWHDLTLIGLRYETNSKNWTWTDGTEVDLLNWLPGDPTSGDLDCALLWSDPHQDGKHASKYQKWGNYPCDQRIRSYVCKKMASQ